MKFRDLFKEKKNQSYTVKDLQWLETPLTGLIRGGPALGTAMQKQLETEVRNQVTMGKIYHIICVLLY